jgi:hypothetical protein
MALLGTGARSMRMPLPSRRGDVREDDGSRNRASPPTRKRLCDIRLGAPVSVCRDAVRPAPSRVICTPLCAANVAACSLTSSRCEGAADTRSAPWSIVTSAIPARRQRTRRQAPPSLGLHRTAPFPSAVGPNSEPAWVTRRIPRSGVRWLEPYVIRIQQRPARRPDLELRSEDAPCQRLPTERHGGARVQQLSQAEESNYEANRRLAEQRPVLRVVVLVSPDASAVLLLLNLGSHVPW